MENEFEPVQEPETQVPEEKPEKSGLSGSQTALLIGTIVVLLAIIAALIVVIVSQRQDAQPQETTPTVTMPEADYTESTDPTDPPATAPADGNPDDETCKGSYTASDTDLLAAHDKVIARLGDAELTNGLLQMYYWRWFYDFVEESGMYLYYYGLDYTAPLDVQMLPDDSETWQQYVLANGLSVWHQFQSLSLAAEEAGFALEPEYEQYLAAMPGDLNDIALENGFADAEAMIRENFGAGCTVADYVEYMRLYYLGYSYFGEQYDAISFTEDEIAAYFAEHAQELGVTDTEETQVDVRHVLLMPKGGTTDENGATVYSDEEWEACRAEAQALLDQFLAGQADEAAFARLANDYSEDPGSNTSGGLYAAVQQNGRFVPEFEGWCFEDGRQVGDTGLIRTSYGYHIMYLANSENVWHYAARAQMVNQAVQSLTDEILGRYAMDVDYPGILIGTVNMR